MAGQRFSNNINIKNRRASYEYELLDKYVAGLVLRGTEIKSIKEGKVNLQDGYCYVNDGELLSKEFISPPMRRVHTTTMSRRGNGSCC